MVELYVLAVGLALDAMAVTASLAASRSPMKQLVGACVVFGAFQAGMAGIGALGGAWVSAWAHPWDHVVAAVLLTGVGVRMAWTAGEDAEEDPTAVVGVGAVLGLAVATSLDALAAGVGIPHIGVGALTAMGVIGLVTTGLCAIAAAVGARLATRLGPWGDRIAGLVLVGLGLRILVGG